MLSLVFSFTIGSLPTHRQILLHIRVSPAADDWKRDARLLRPAHPTIPHQRSPYHRKCLAC